MSENKNLVRGYEVVIGLEIHAQILSVSKVFSPSSAAYVSTAKPNSQVSYIDAAYPGMLPLINEHCVYQTIKTGLGMNAKINRISRFDRKSYFYPDLPSGYQLTQLFTPLVGEGVVEIDLKDGSTKKIRLERIHLEQDAAKLVHDLEPGYSAVDLNRAGMGLMEMVSKPDLSSAEEVAEYVQKIRSIVRYLGTCDADMSQGSMRCDVNVSVNKPGRPFGTRVEMKNVNSIRFIQQAIHYEVNRQIDLIEKGETFPQQTRGFNSDTGETYLMRLKENAEDYRYFPDPDQLPLEVTEDYIAAIKKSLPELPDAKKKRYIAAGIPVGDAVRLVRDKEVADYFDIAAKGRDVKKVANWVIVELMGYLNEKGVTITDSPIPADNLGALVGLINDNTISGKIAKDVFVLMTGEDLGKTPHEIVEKRGLRQVVDTGAIEKVVDKVISAQKDKVDEIRQGKVQLLGWLVGQCMKESQGKANPAMLNEILKKKIGI